MHTLLLLPLLACLLCTAFACAVLGRDPSQRGTRLNAGIILGAAFWALCEIIWNTRSDPETALFFVRVSALGWVGLGPMALDLMLGATGETMPRVRRAMPWLYATSAAFLLVTWTTPYTWVGVTEVAWGWGPQPGPVLLLYVFFALGTGAIGFQLGMELLRNGPGPGERKQAPWVLVGMVATSSAALVTDVALPLLGIQVPRLGASSFIVPTAIGFWLTYRYGYFMITPGVFTREMLDVMPTGVALLDRRGRIRNVNRALEALTGLPARVLEGERLRDRIAAAPADPLTEVDEIECQLRDASGRQLPVALSLHRATDRQGLAVAVLAVVRDLREVVMLRQRLVTSGRLAAVGELAAGVAHEINNPMAYVRANLTRLRSHWFGLVKTLESSAGADALPDWADEGDELFEDTFDGVERTCSIVREIKGFAAAGQGVREVTHLQPLLESTLRVARPRTRAACSVETNFAVVPPVPCNPQELKQVFLNLILNAAHAVGERGTIRVGVSAAGAEVVVTVDDDGHGIASADLERIFDPFFTTKPAGEGTGLGLSISYEIVRKHGGVLEVESEPGRGASFRVCLPAAPSEALD